MCVCVYVCVLHFSLSHQRRAPRQQQQQRRRRRRRRRSRHHPDDSVCIYVYIRVCVYVFSLLLAPLRLLLLLLTNTRARPANCVRMCVYAHDVKKLCANNTSADQNDGGGGGDDDFRDVIGRGHAHGLFGDFPSDGGNYMLSIFYVPLCVYILRIWLVPGDVYLPLRRRRRRTRCSYDVSVAHAQRVLFRGGIFTSVRQRCCGCTAFTTASPLHASARSAHSAALLPAQTAN